MQTIDLSRHLKGAYCSFASHRRSGALSSSLHPPSSSFAHFSSFFFAFIGGVTGRDEKDGETKGWGGVRVAVRVKTRKQGSFLPRFLGSLVVPPLCFASFVSPSAHITNANVSFSDMGAIFVSPSAHIFHFITYANASFQIWERLPFRRAWPRFARGLPWAPPQGVCCCSMRTDRPTSSC